MNSKLKKKIKYILIYIFVFVLTFCSMCLCTQAAENEALEFSFYNTPTIKVWNGTTWDDIDFGAEMTTTVYDNGKTQKLTMSVEPYSNGFEIGKFYRVTFRFRLVGDFAKSTECKFDMQFVGPATGNNAYDYNPKFFTYSSAKPNQSFGNIWYKEGQVSEVRDTATITPINPHTGNGYCWGANYSYPVPSFDYNIECYQCSFGFYVTENQYHSMKIEMSNFSFPLLLPEFSDSAVNEYNDLGNDILLGTQGGRDGAISIFNSFGDTLAVFQNGIIAVGSILNEFFQISAFSTLINISLSIGLFAFVVGMTINVIVKFSSGNSPPNIDNGYKGKHSK